MSKSKGNVINPMEMVARHGSDALRLGIIASRSAAQNQAFSEGKVIAGRNFCNKLWNIARYIEDKLGDSHVPRTPEPTTLADHWIISRLEAAAQAIDSQLADYRFSEAGDTVYHTIWDDVADWYIEASKTTESLDMLAYVLDTSLKLAHPFAPFVTETIWQSLNWHEDLLIQGDWPTEFNYSAISAAEFTRLQALVSEARFVTAELPGNSRYNLLYLDDSLVADNADLIKHLARVKEVIPIDTPRGLRLATSGRDAWLDVDSDTLYEHQSNLEVRLAETRQELTSLTARLENKAYVEKAPARLVEETRQAIQDKETLITRLEHELNSL